MSDTNKYRINFARLLRLAGFNIPVKDDEIEEFEKNSEKFNRKPVHFDDPTQILKTEKNYKVDMKGIMNVETSDQISMAAREGGEIPDDIRKKMDEDRKKSEE